MRFPFTGVIPVDKPTGSTSRQVVDVVARALGMRAVGHAGTLDPLAEGVVVACVGHATRLVDYLHELPKRYVATFLLGRSSPSDDLETPQREQPDPPRPARHEIEEMLPRFHGTILQRPCDYSAVHVGGTRAYRLARQGRPPSLEARPVCIDRLEITHYDWPRLGLDVVCSSGTFVRAIGRDLAAAVGTFAVMEGLVRTGIGPFVRDAALPLAAVGPDAARAALLPASAAVGHVPRLTLAGPRLEHAARGGLVEIEAVGSALAAFDESGDLVGILSRHGCGRWRLRPNFRGGA